MITASIRVSSTPAIKPPTTPPPIWAALAEDLVQLFEDDLSR